MTSFMATPFMSKVLAASGDHSGNQIDDAPARPTTLADAVDQRGIEVVIETRRTDDGRWISSADGGGHRRAALATTDQVEQLLLGLMTSSPKGTTCSTN